MGNPNSLTLIKEVIGILVISVVLSFVFNAFSSKKLPLIRVAPNKVVENDSTLFPQLLKNESAIKDSVISTPKRDSSIQNQSSPVKTAKQETQKKTEDNIYHVVTLSQMQRLVNERHAVLIDARDADSYNKAHIKGAVNMFGDEPEQHFEEMTKLSPDTLVVVYCNGPDCHLGRNLIQFMNVLEFKHLYLYDDGWDGWQKANMPVEKSSNP